MKKVLLATSALTMMAGAASAEIALSGSARMGLVFNDTAAGSDAFFSSRVRIVFTASGETDTGLSFGASFRADNAGGANGNTNMGSGTIKAVAKQSMAGSDSAEETMNFVVDRVQPTLATVAAKG